MNLAHVLALLAAGSAVPAATAQFITPSSATASSEFSASYSINNTINGSGLPAGFDLNDAHANYVAGNHWTTQSGRTVGESATFTFNQAQALGAFYLWNHRSNGVASNSFYEPVLFDLELFDGPGGTGASLLLLTNVAAQPNVATGQAFVFNATAGVRSARFTVRATENGNASPFTGLAEVRFGPCVPVSLPSGGQPVGVAVCPGQEASFAVAPAGSGPFGIVWQYRVDGQEGWLDLHEGINESAGVAFTAVGAASPGVTVYPSGAWLAETPVRFQAAVSGPCGQAVSQQAAVLVDPADAGSVGGLPGRDQMHDNNDFIAFIGFFFNGDPRADLGRSGGVFGSDGEFNNNDFIAFINRFFIVCG
ncbi:MAG: hypothetical protein K2Q09_00140 [Phycisphaerales bacterium]|nr:hypothetical protein [Phycisphaerales bacterium]